MEPEEYDAMYQLEESLWWYRGMRKITNSLLQEFLPARRDLDILDVGAGTGGSLPLLQPFGNVTAFDFSAQAVDYYTTRKPGRIAQASAAAIPFRTGAFDLVTIFDVFTTLDDEAEATAVSEVARVVKPGGFLFWREPALMFLYGPHDRAVHSKRRYTTAGLRDRLKRNGLEPVRLSYANTLLFPIAAARRLIAKWKPANGSAPPRSDVQEVPDVMNTVFTGVLSLEAPLIPRVPLPIGLSVLTLARRQ